MEISKYYIEILCIIAGALIISGNFLLFPGLIPEDIFSVVDRQQRLTVF